MEAVRRGLVTRAQLRGDRYLSPFRGVYLRVRDQPPDLAALSRAAFLLLGESGALAGYSAAELLDASCAPPDVPVEIVSPGTGIRARPGLVVHRDVVEPSEVWRIKGCRVTSPMRTAWDLARRATPRSPSWAGRPCASPPTTCGTLPTSCTVSLGCSSPDSVCSASRDERRGCRRAPLMTTALISSGLGRVGRGRVAGVCVLPGGGRGARRPRRDHAGVAAWPVVFGCSSGAGFRWEPRT